ncbi:MULTISPECIES: hypothetical protein [Burkholderia]|uniref:Uncharacterized protein n=2 Tax=Burkholderia cepacia complex TaxID=87882 RepID=A0AAP1YCQ3_9BURK|nr:MULTISPECIES: hypothetical protein [Burkholderia]MBK1901980.1 hypothetical protein [Burkholderia contaminans]MBK1910263.1 hypothetical protein [Burkholderia contaminans]MBK1923722.1 hypothetical protein [Burkholderia contaminans]MBK1931934.1 hypothetical protein [Burkholderia contaminans]MBK1939183.1 hypothetical protein [Burkholderia contaminans]
MTSKNEEQFIKIAADSIASLRKTDVFRVLDTIRCDNIDGVTRSDLAGYITKMRPDLVTEVEEVMRDEFPGEKWRDEDALTADVVPSCAKVAVDTSMTASSVRSAADNLTVAYIAIAARETLSQRTVELDGFNGELGFLEAATDHALFVDRVSDWFDGSGHPGVFAYDVAAPFGAAFANAMIEGRSMEIAPEPLLRAVMVSSFYEPTEVDKAIAAVRP